MTSQLRFISAITRYAYDGDGIWADLSSTSVPQTEYLRGDATDELFARSSGSSVAAWYQTDRLGSVREILNSSGTISDRVNYDGFGNVTSETAPSVGDRWKWTGRSFSSTAAFRQALPTESSRSRFLRFCKGLCNLRSESSHVLNQHSFLDLD